MLLVRFTSRCFSQFPCASKFLVRGAPGDVVTVRSQPLADSTATVLHPGTAVQGSAPPSGYVYFKLATPSPASDIYFDVTPFNGDPDVFVTCEADAHLTGDDSGAPSLGTSKWGSLAIGIDTVLIQASDSQYCNGAFIAGVSSFGPWPSNFSLVATTAEHNTVTLNNGYPQDGSVELQHYAYYSFTAPSPDKDTVIDLALATSSGDADMYITLDGREPSRTVWDYHGVGTGATEIVSIRGDGAGCPRPGSSTCKCPAGGACTVKIAVYGYRRSVYSITASLNGVERRLQDNVPALVHVNVSQYAFFRYDVPLAQLDGKRLTVTVNPVNGDPDLFVSKVYSTPTAATKAQHPADVFVSASFGDDDVVITPAEGLSAGTYHIGVQAFGVGSTFSVVAALTDDSQTTITGLLPGTPSTGSVLAGEFTMYGFTAQFGDAASVQDVRFTITPLNSGEMTVYVRKCPKSLEAGCQAYLPSTTEYDFTSVHTANSEVVMIHHDDPEACTDCVYVVGVYGTDEGFFSVTASTGQLHSILRSNVPTQDVIAAQTYHYFTFFVNSNEDVAISVTPFNGDVDLVVSACGYVDGQYNGDTCTTNPNMSSYDWASFGFGNDTVFIPTSDRKRCQPVVGVPCIYNIGVYGFQPSSFSILGSMHSDDNTILLPGTPQSGSVGQDVLDNFEMFVRPHVTQATFTLTTTAGDADLYILVNATRGRAGPVSIGKFDFTAQNIYGDDTLTIDMTGSKVQQYCPNFASAGCVLGVGIWGAADYPSTFSLIGTVVGGGANPVQQLSEGISATATVQPGAYQYFSFAVSQPESVIISVTPTGTGDPNLYVSNSLQYLPTKGNHTYASTRQGFDVLTIGKFPSNPKACPSKAGETCTLAIGVAVADGSSASTFNILVRTNDGEPTLLQPGVRMRSSVTAGQQDQYIMSLVDESYEHLEVSLQSLVGDADLYVTLDGTEPTPRHWQFASLSQAAHDYVVIHKSDAAWRTYCSHKVVCPVRVAVRGFRDTTYDIVASTNDSPVQLTAGQVTYDHVSAGLYDYFMFTTHLQSGNLRFVLQGLSGDPDMAIGRGDLGQFRPTLNNASSYIRTSTYSDLDVIEIDHNDHDACKGPCTYFIGVTGDRSNSSFGISVSEVNSSEVFTLVDGQSVLGYVSPHTTAQALWVVQRSAKNMTVTVNPISGDPDLYINVGAAAEAPNALSHDYASISMNGQDEVRMQWSDGPFTQHCAGLPSCVVRVGVQGFKTSWFYLTASSSLLTTLQENVAQTASVQPDEYTYFAFTVSNAGAAAFSLTAVSGDPDMYIGTDPVNLPTSGNFNFSETAIGGGSLEIYPGDEHACEAPCTYYIGVTGFFEAATFSILARTRSTAPVRLTDGRPQIDSVQAGQRNYYIVDVPVDDPTTEFEISLTPRFGDADLYARLDDGPLDREHFQYFSMYSGADRIAITGNDGPYNASCKGTVSCSAHIMVYGFSAGEYTLVATSRGNLHRLDDGTPFAEDSQPGHPEFFVFRVDNDADISFALSVTSGDADMYITNSADNTTRPSSSEFTWKSSGLGYESVFIEKNDGRAVACAKPCFYYVGVYAFGGSSTAYSLTASTGVPSLPPGRPVAGLVDRAKFAYFLFQAAPGVKSFTVTIAASRGVAVGYIGNEISARTGDLIKPTLVCNPDSVACSSYIVQHAAWATAGSSGNTMTVRSTDPQWRDGGQYIVGVLAPPTASSYEAAFTVTATSSDTTTELADGIPAFGSVDEGEYEYYFVTVADRTEDVLLQATAFSGDNDLYVSVHPNNTTPSQGSGFDFFAVSFGNDSVYLTAAQLQVCHEQAASMGLAACRVYVGVYGFTNAQYSILAKVSGREQVLLTDGVPQSGFVPAGSYAYYRAVVDFPADNQLAYSVVVTPRSGDPDLFILSSKDALPSASDYDRRAIGFGRESIVFTPGDATYNASGVLHIAVFGWSTDCTFDIVFATQSNEQTLSDGRSSQVNILPRSSMFLRFPFPAQSTADLQYAIAPLSGSVDFFITRPENSTSSSRPGPDNYIWKGHASAGGAANTISRSDSRFVAGVDYVFGLYNNDGSIATTVSIVAHLSTTLVSLTDGASQLGGVAAGDYEYFTYSCGASCTWKDLTVSATPVGSGNVRVVVTDLYVPGTGEGTLPTLQSNVWSSDTGASTDPNTITIPADDPKHTPGKTVFTIGVFGKGVNTAFNVLATTSEEPTFLRMGQPSARVSVQRGDTKHFYTYLESKDDDLVITVTPLSGDADLLVSATDPNPYCTLPSRRALGAAHAPRYSRKLVAGQEEALQHAVPGGAHSFGVGTKLRTCHGARWLTAGDNANSAPDVLTIQAADPCGSVGTNITGCDPEKDWRPGFYYIGVFAQTTTTFSVTSYFNSIASLTNGEAATASASALTPVYFMFEDGGDVDGAAHDIKLVVTRTLEENKHPVSLFVYANACRASQCTQAQRRPSAGNFAPNAAFQVSKDRASFFITPLDQVYCTPVEGDECNYYFGVSASCAGGVNPLACSQGFQLAVTLQDGNSVEVIGYSSIAQRMAVVSSVAPAGSKPLFETYLSGTGPTDLNVRLSTCSGAYSAAYICDPSPGSPRACTDAFSPGPNDNTYSAVTSFDSGGRAYVNVSGSTASSVYLAVQETGGAAHTLALPAAGAAGHARVQQSANSSFTFELDLYSSQAYVVTVPADSVTASVHGATVDLAWEAAVLRRGGEEVPMQAAEYRAFAAPKGFDLRDVASGVPTTACGVEAWAAAHADTPGVALTTAEEGALRVSVGGLQANTDYQFALMVTCDLDCWAATLGVNSSDSHALQRSMYQLSALVRTGEPSAAPSPAAPGLAPGIKAVLGVSVVLLVAAVVAGVWWYRRRAARQRNQYNVLSGEQYSIQSASTDGVGNYSRLVDDGQAEGGDAEFNSKLAQYLD